MAPALELVQRVLGRRRWSEIRKQLRYQCKRCGATTALLLRNAECYKRTTKSSRGRMATACRMLTPTVQAPRRSAHRG